VEEKSREQQKEDLSKHAAMAAKRGAEDKQREKMGHGLETGGLDRGPEFTRSPTNEEREHSQKKKKGGRHWGTRRGTGVWESQIPCEKNANLKKVKRDERRVGKGKGLSVSYWCELRRKAVNLAVGA